MNHFDPLARRRALDRNVIGVIGINAVLCGLLGSVHGRLGEALVAAAIGGIGAALAQLRRLSPGASAWVLGASLCASVLAVIHFGKGQAEFALGILLAISLLVGYRDWRLVLAAGATFAAAQLAAAWPLTAAPYASLATALHDPLALGLGLITLHTALLTRVTQRAEQMERERFDVEFLVRAMGRSGAIRLNLDVLKAESPLGQRLKHVQERMGRAMLQVSESTAGVSRAAEVMKDSGTELMQRTESSASGLRDVAMCLEQINVIVKTNAAAALDARATADDASRLAGEAGTGIEQMVAQMSEIDRSSRRITEIIGVIDSIAFQTNILALNAAVEAARAGEQGRGFAVVASEVRNLANRSSTAAGEIKALIAESMQAVGAGNTLAVQAGRTMGELVGAVGRVSAVFNDLSADTDEHANSIDAVNVAVRDLDEITSQNVTLAERADQVARDLVVHAESLAEVLGAFQLGGALGRARDVAQQAASERLPPPAPAEPRAAGRPAAAADGSAVVEFF